MKSLLIALIGLFGGPLLDIALAQPAVERLERQVREKQRAEAENDVGYLGVVADDSKGTGHGVEVLEVVAGSPAEKGGLKPGDLVTKVGDRPIRTLDDFADALHDQPAGKTLRFAIERMGEPKQVEATLVSRPPVESRRFPRFGRIGEPAAELPRMSLLGVRVEPVDPQSPAAVGLPVAEGAYVVGVAENSPAAMAGIPLQAVIVAIDGQEVRDPADLKRVIAGSRPGDNIKVDYYSGGKLVQRRVRLAEVRPDAPLAEPEPPAEATAKLADRQRIEQLERRIRVLEARIAELERSIGSR